jgi:hypothetical protein
LFAAAPWSARGENSSPEPDDLAGKHEVSDATINKRLGELDGALQKRTDEINNDFAEMQTFEARLKDDKLNFERSMIDERRTFLEKLKKTAKDDRWKEFRDFKLKQNRERETFRSDQKKARSDFYAARDEYRHQYLDNVKPAKPKAG